MEQRENGRLFVRVGLLACGVALVPACTSDAKPPREGPMVVAAWDFPPEPVAPLLRLWPADASTPKRKDRSVSPTLDEGKLSMLVEGEDPRFSWVLEPPVAAAVVTVEVEAEAAGPLQLFWATSRCPTFSQDCSATADVARGRNDVGFLVDPEDPLRSLRLDPPEGRGKRYAFSRIVLLGDGVVDAPWTARETVAALDLGPMGLTVVAAVPDPGMTAQTPGLDAARVTAVELVMHGSPSNPPQLFWDGPCHSFSEECSAKLLPADAGATTHRAALKGSAKWSGRIGALRFDPGPSEGRYVVERLALIHDLAE